MNLTQSLIEQFPFHTALSVGHTGNSQGGWLYLYLLAFPFVSEPVFAVCTNPALAGNRWPVHGKVIKENISNSLKNLGENNPAPLGKQVT